MRVRARVGGNLWGGPITSASADGMTIDRILVTRMLAHLRAGHGANRA